MAGHKPFKNLADRMSDESKSRSSSKVANSKAFAAAYQIIASLAGECNRLNDPAVVAALDYFQAAADGNVQDVGKVLPFSTTENPPVS